jgi:branched-chain amino acid transport system ATP-binding protein
MYKLKFKGLTPSSPLVEQNARLALNYSNKGYVMEMGEIVLQGTPEILLDNEDVRKAYLGV